MMLHLLPKRYSKNGSRDECWYNHAVKKSPRLVIIGAGPAGLGAAWRLTELGYHNFILLERESYVGGLATSFVDAAGFTWDIGGHVLHSHYPYFDGVFESVMQGEYFTHQRESWVMMGSSFVPFPFQNNIHRLPKRVMDACFRGLQSLDRKKNKSPSNFSEWITATYGNGIAEHFMHPYNRKVWAYPLELMSYQWVADRVAPVDIRRIAGNIKGKKDDVSWGPNAVFRYPKRGGTGDIWQRVAARFAKKIHCNTQVVSIDTNNRLIHVRDGGSVRYDELFTSLPLDRLTRMVSGVSLPEDTNTLMHSAVTVVGIGISGRVPENLKTKCWIYFPDADVPFFRATVLSNYSPFNAPSGTWSLLTEISSSAEMPLPEGDIPAAVIKSAKKIGLIPTSAKVVDIWKMTSDYGYPTPTLGRDAIVDPVLTVLEEAGIYSRGRFGLWKYEVSNQDHTFMQGVEWANLIIAGKTYQ